MHMHMHMHVHVQVHATCGRFKHELWRLAGVTFISPPPSRGCKSIELQ